MYNPEVVSPLCLINCRSFYSTCAPSNVVGRMFIFTAKSIHLFAHNAGDEEWPNKTTPCLEIDTIIHEEIALHVDLQCQLQLIHIVYLTTSWQENICS